MNEILFPKMHEIPIFRISTMMFTHESDYFIFGNESDITILTTCDFQLAYTLCGHTEWVRSLALSPDGTKLASGSYDKSVIIWDWNSKN